MQYRRLYQPGAQYFFTVVTYQRRPILTNADVLHALKTAIKKVQQKYPFKINALVILPDHLHTIWQLPDNDSDFSMRWNQIGIVDKMVANFEIPYAYWTKWWLISDFSHFFYLENPV